MVAVAFAASPLAAQAAARGFDQERLGRYAEAADTYLETLRDRPGDEAALLGLERVLPRLGRTVELLGAARRARAAAPASAVARGVEIRALAELGAVDSLAAAALDWAAAQPRSEEPYREWILALADRGLVDEARRVVRQGRRTLGRPEALALIAAEVELRAGDWAAAAREWRGVVASTAEQDANAVHQLGDAPADQRSGVLAALTEGTAPAASRRLAAGLMLGWGRAIDGWRLLEGALEGPPQVVTDALRDFAQRAEGVGGREAERARGYALAALADRAPPPLAARLRGQAARALLNGGDAAAARLELERVARAADVTTATRAAAEGALIELLIRDGALEEAAAHLRAVDALLAGEEAQALRHDLARAHIGRGELVAADTTLGGDSSVTAAALRGWIALYRGELAVADSLFRRAGPYAGERRDATARTQMLAVLQVVKEDRAPELGRALLLLARGDSAAAVGALRDVANRLAPAARAAVLALAGRVAARPGADVDRALALLDQAVRADSAGAFAPEAELLAARVLLRAGRTPEAIARLERIILNYPHSAFTPEARRELERARGAIPRS